MAMIYLTNVTIAFKSYLQHLKHVTYFLVCTHVTGDVCVSTGSKDRNCIPLHLEPLGLFFFPIVLVAVLQRDNQKYYDMEGFFF